MKALLLSGVLAAMCFSLPACETKVYNQQPAARPTVIERDRPVVTEEQHEPPPVDVHVHD